MKDLLVKTFDHKGDVFDLFALFSHQPNVFFLDSSFLDQDRGRYSFIGFDPFEVFESKHPQALNPLKEAYSKYKTSFGSALTPLSSGLVGFVSYDYGLYQERIRLHAQDDLNMPLCRFGFYDCILTIDHWTNKVIVTSTGLPYEGKRRLKRAEERLEYIAERIGPILCGSQEGNKDCDDNETNLTLNGFLANMTEEEYYAAVKRAKYYIAEGDIYQVNLSQRFDLDLKGRKLNPEDIYRILRRYSPAPFGAYLEAGKFSVISNSPERFLRCQNGLVQTRPMKGTRPRGENLNEDQKLKEELWNSKKDMAELLMITDLERNDLGKVCEVASVCVKDLRNCESYQTVFQTTSLVEGRLEKDKDCFDLLEACFPGGSITGCPKIRAMEVIEELEPTRRGIYTGAFGYISFNGDMDLSILIRTILMKDNHIYFQVGGGIVADSNPSLEYEETLVKAKALKRCLQKVIKNEVVFNSPS